MYCRVVLEIPRGRRKRGIEVEAIVDRKSGMETACKRYHVETEVELEAWHHVEAEAVQNKSFILDCTSMFMENPRRFMLCCFANKRHSQRLSLIVTSTVSLLLPVSPRCSS